MTAYTALSILVCSCVFTLTLKAAVNSPNRVRNAKIAGVFLAICTGITVFALISIG